MSHSKLSNDSHSPDDGINFSSSELVSEMETIENININCYQDMIRLIFIYLALLVSLAKRQLLKGDI